MARRRTKRNPALDGRDTFHVTGLPAGATMAPRAQAPHALNVAQRIAERFAPVTPLTLYVERHSLLGPKVQMYRVDRDEHGVVFTTTLNPED